MDKVYEKSLELVTRVFSGKKDKGGFPYLDHLLTVSQKGHNKDEKLVGLLHDILEDTNTNIEELKEIGCTKKVIDAVKVLTKKKGETYIEYIDRIKNSSNSLAISVKLNDLEHNMDLGRIAIPTEEDYERIKKYENAYKKLSGGR